MRFRRHILVGTPITTEGLGYSDKVSTGFQM